MTSVIAKVVYKFWPSWREDVEVLFKRYDTKNQGVVPQPNFFSSLTSCGLNLTSIVKDRLIAQYSSGGHILYKSFLKDLTEEVDEINGAGDSIKFVPKKNESIVSGIISGEIDPSGVRKPVLIPNPIYDTKDEEDVDEDQAELEFKEKFLDWIDLIIKNYEPKEKRDKSARDLSPNERDRYSRLFFLLISEQARKSTGKDDGNTRIPELLLCIPDWPQVTITYEMFYKVCIRELPGIKYLAQIYSTNAVPAQSIHTTMTFQQFSILSSGISDCSLSRMVQHLKEAASSTPSSSSSKGAKGGLYSKFTSWKDFTLGFVSAQSLYDGIKRTIPTEPSSTISEFVKRCIGENARKETDGTEPVLFSAFSSLVRNECLPENDDENTKGKGENEKERSSVECSSSSSSCTDCNNEKRADTNSPNDMGGNEVNGGLVGEEHRVFVEDAGCEKGDKEEEQEEDEEECERKCVHEIKMSLLEAVGNNSDKIYGMLVYAAINNPPFRSDVITPEAIIRTIVSGLSVRLSPQQQFLITQHLKEASSSNADGVVPVRLFLEEFGLSKRGAPMSIPPVVTSPERHGRFIKSVQIESEAKSPTIARHVNSKFASKYNSSRNLVAVLEQQNEAVVSTPTRPVEKTGVEKSFMPEEGEPKTPRRLEEDGIQLNIVEDSQLFAEKRKECLEQASRAAELRRRRGYSDDLYRSEDTPPSRRGSRGASSAGVRGALCWGV